MKRIWGISAELDIATARDIAVGAPAAGIVGPKRDLIRQNGRETRALFTKVERDANEAVVSTGVNVGFLFASADIMWSAFISVWSACATKIPG